MTVIQCGLTLDKEWDDNEYELFDMYASVAIRSPFLGNIYDYMKEYYPGQTVIVKCDMKIDDDIDIKIPKGVIGVSFHIPEKKKE